VKKAWGWLGPIVIALWAGEAVALMIPLSTEELALSSDVVVEGIAGPVRSSWSPDHRRILSAVDVEVTEVVRGALVPRSVTVEYEGGRVGDLVMRVEDMEPIAGGEHMVLFLKRGSVSGGESAHWSLVGYSQGQYVVGADGVARKGGFSVLGESAKVDLEIALDDLKAKVRRAR